MNRQRVSVGHRRHRVIVPVYIPNTTGYFAHSVEILRICLDTLLATIDPGSVSLTVINNESVQEVDDLLMKEFEAGRLDRYIRHRWNRGKPDPVAGEILASYERFITIADCDVLFMPGWLTEVDRTFEAFPGAGSVSPFPAPKLHSYYAANSWLAGALNLSLTQGEYVADADLDQFAASLGKPDFYDGADRRLQFALRRGDRVALIGGGHFVVTLRRKAYEGFVYRPGLGGMGRAAGEDQIDGQIERSGYMRLSTPRAWVFHMGNTPETWMHAKAREVLASPPPLLGEDEADGDTAGAGPPAIGKLPYGLRRALARPFGWYVALRKRALRGGR